SADRDGRLNWNRSGPLFVARARLTSVIFTEVFYHCSKAELLAMASRPLGDQEIAFGHLLSFLLWGLDGTDRDEMWIRIGGMVTYREHVFDFSELKMLSMVCPACKAEIILDVSKVTKAPVQCGPCGKPYDVTLLDPIDKFISAYRNLFTHEQNGSV